VEIELRQHQDGSYTLEVKSESTSREIDVTKAIHEVVREKIKDLKARVRAEEKYRNWIVDSTRDTNSTISTAYARYSSVLERLRQTNEVILMVWNTWNQKKDLKVLMTRLMEVEAQNRHFVQNDGTLTLLQRMMEEED